MGVGGIEAHTTYLTSGPILVTPHSTFLQMRNTRKRPLPSALILAPQPPAQTHERLPQLVPPLPIRPIPPERIRRARILCSTSNRISLKFRQSVPSSTNTQYMEVGRGATYFDEELVARSEQLVLQLRMLLKLERNGLVHLTDPSISIYLPRTEDENKAYFPDIHLEPIASHV